MKTAISIPEPLFEAAERMAHRLAVSRSELYARAMADYLERHKYLNVTKALNRVHGEPRATRQSVEVGW